MHARARVFAPFGEGRTPARSVDNDLPNRGQPGENRTAVSWPYWSVQTTLVANPSSVSPACAWRMLRSVDGSIVPSVDDCPLSGGPPR